MISRNKTCKLMARINSSFKILQRYQGLSFSACRTLLKNKAIDSRQFAGTADNAHAAQHQHRGCGICAYTSSQFIIPPS